MGYPSLFESNEERRLAALEGKRTKGHQSESKIRTPLGNRRVGPTPNPPPSQHPKPPVPQTGWVRRGFFRVWVGE